LLRDPDAASRDALLRLDALLARPWPAGLLQEHAIHARAIRAARVAAQRTVFIFHGGRIAGLREFDGSRSVRADRKRVLPRAAYSSR